MLQIHQQVFLIYRMFKLNKKMMDLSYQKIITTQKRIAVTLQTKKRSTLEWSSLRNTLLQVKSVNSMILKLILFRCLVLLNERKKHIVTRKTLRVLLGLLRRFQRIATVKYGRVKMELRLITAAIQVIWMIKLLGKENSKS